MIYVAVISILNYTGHRAIAIPKQSKGRCAVNSISNDNAYVFPPAKMIFPTQADYHEIENIWKIKII